jgi:hypothetical protein
LKSRQKYADLVNEKIDGEYGLGKIRTHGEWTNTGLPATIEGAVTSGRKCAELIIGI